MASIIVGVKKVCKEQRYKSQAQRAESTHQVVINLPAVEELQYTMNEDVDT